MRTIIFTILLLAASTAANAQLGKSQPGITVLTVDSIGRTTIGAAATPKCDLPGTCNGGCPVFIFNGAGNWDIPCNWQDNIVPPAVLPDCYQVVIDGSGDCIFNVPSQTIPINTKIIIMQGKKLVVPGGIIVQ